MTVKSKKRQKYENKREEGKPNDEPKRTEEDEEELEEEEEEEVLCFELELELERELRLALKLRLGLRSRAMGEEALELRVVLGGVFSKGERLPRVSSPLEATTGNETRGGGKLNSLSLRLHRS